MYVHMTRGKIAMTATGVANLFAEDIRTVAGGPRPCLSEPTPEAPPLQQGQFTSMGNMAESTKRSATVPDFGTLTRDDRRHVFISEAACVAQPRDRMGPGPGSHDLPSSLLEQPQSTKRSAPTPKFTTLSRPHMRCLHSERGGRAHVTPLGRNPSTQCTLCCVRLCRCCIMVTLSVA